uniref:Uncharacterized protein n=1 Tax=Plectus sambesii TaxID=2011161 RepID=A0A914XH03_9BILA
MRLYLLVNAACCVTFCNGIGGKSQRMLINEALMENYDRFNRPVLNTSHPVTIRVNPSLFSIIEVDVAKQTLTFKQWLNMYWYDPHLIWNPDLYEGVDQIMMQRSTIWLPDIVIVEQTSVDQVSDELSVAKIKNDGYVSIASDQLVTVTCQYDVSNFPYDTQNCSLRFSSWMYSAQEIDPYANEPTDLTVYNENGEWTLRSYTSRKRTSMADGDVYVDLYYDIKITRKPSYYITTFIWPSFLITCLSIVGVFSPFNDAGEREEKLTMGLTTLLTMAVILMIITDQMPKSSNGIPLLGTFIMLEIGIASVATLVSVFIIYTHRNWMDDAPVPNWLLQLTCMSEKKRESTSPSAIKQAWKLKDNMERESRSDPKLLVTIRKGTETLNLNINISDMRNESLRDQWSKVTHRLDLFLMIIFLIANVIICVIVMAIGNSKLND